ncbi:unnamed protein product [Nippostrongylus brasiliensis]|uniref:SSD domain-containing protein n=1 Tax=Nippostrongylus brasiliensis TaxID=27835 RepID=A0A0N4Y9G2_NIPBR|nr:unnamed protein product [Nippostrongylus brasiliensis]
MIRLDYLRETVQILDLVSSRFLMYDADRQQNQSFDQFCGGFCQANEPVRQFYNGMLVLQGNTSDELQQRITLAYPTSEIFSTKFSLLPNFFGVELDADGKAPKFVSLIALMFRAEKHPSWTVDMVKQWELNVEEYFKNYDQQRIEVNALSAAIVEHVLRLTNVTSGLNYHFSRREILELQKKVKVTLLDIVVAGKSLQPFLVIGFLIMCIFCTSTTIASSVIMFRHRATYRKVLLSVTACVLPFMACGSALGLVFLLGINFSPLLCITPFLVLAISVDDAFLMVHAWNRIEKNDYRAPKPRAEKMAQFLLPLSEKALEALSAQVCVETGPAIAISAFTNILAFAIGAVSSSPEVRIFCIGNAACIFFDMLYQLTFYTAIMSLLADSSEPPAKEESDSRIKEAAKKLLHWYSSLIADVKVSLTVALLWSLFVAGAFVGSSYATVDLSSQKMFLPDSKLIQIDRIRNRYMVPSYTPATLVVSNPGNLSDAENINELNLMKTAFESLPNAIGSESTKFFMSDFVNYKNVMQEQQEGDPSAASLDAFLNWPEYAFWRGFLKRDNTSEWVFSGIDDVKQFIFITGYQGEHLGSWTEKGRLLKTRFNVSVFSEDGFYIDLLDSIPSITWQSGLVTFFCVIVICALFINHPATILFVSMAIFASCIGVFGYMSLFGITLDPIVMAISIMCIGFSVDIPAHVSFHFHASKSHLEKQSSCSTITPEEEKDEFKTRLEHTIASVGFPVIQAGLSTNLCALPLAFVPLYMAQVFALAMLLCISFSLIHGILVLPAMFCLYDRASTAILARLRRQKRCAPV